MNITGEIKYNCQSMQSEIGKKMYYLFGKSNQCYEVELIGYDIDKYRIAYKIDFQGQKIMVDIDFTGSVIFNSKANAMKRSAELNAASGGVL